MMYGEIIVVEFPISLYIDLKKHSWVIVGVNRLYYVVPGTLSQSVIFVLQVLP